MRSQLRIKFKRLKVKDLFPLQKEVSLKKTLKLQGKVEDFNPIVTLNSKYIIDGHHRWASLYSLNPESYIESYDITLNSKLSNILSKFKSTYSSEEKSSNSNIYSLDSEEMLSKLNKIYNNQLSKKTILNNLTRLKSKNLPVKGALPRGYMPQIDTNI